MEIKINLIQKTDEKGRAYYESEYDPSVLKDLCLALLTDNAMKETAKMAMVYILSQEDNPEALLDHMRDYAEEIRKEASGKKANDTNNE